MYHVLTRDLTLVMHLDYDFAPEDMQIDSTDQVTVSTKHPSSNRPLAVFFERSNSGTTVRSVMTRNDFKIESQ